MSEYMPVYEGNALPLDTQWRLPMCKTLCILSSILSTISLHSGLSNMMGTARNRGSILL